MAELGERLKKARLAKGLTVELVSGFTKINPDYIEALETNDFEALPAEIYVRGFIKVYGLYLGLNIDELFGLYEAEKPKPKARRIFSGKPKEPPPFASPIPTVKNPHKQIIPQKIKLNRSVLLGGFGLIVVIFVIVFAVVNRGRKSEVLLDSSESFAITDSQTGNSQSRLLTMITRSDLTQEIRLELGKINPAWAIGRADSLTLGITVRQKTWVLVETDYKRAFKGDISTKDTLRFRAKNSFFLTMGAPNVFHLTINGFDLAEYPQRTYAMDLEINRGNVLQLLEGAEQIPTRRFLGPNIIGLPQEQNPKDTTEKQPQPTSRRPVIRRPTPEKPLPNVNTPPPEGPRNEDNNE